MDGKRMRKKIPNIPNLPRPNKGSVKRTPNGIVIKRHESGSKDREMMWKNGELHGKVTVWMGGEYRWYEGMWRDDKLHGMVTYWHANDQKSDERYYIGDREYALIERDEEGNITYVNLPIRSPIINPAVTSKNHIKPKLS